MRISLIWLLLVFMAKGFAASMPDTGQQQCWDGTNLVACTAANTGDGASYPRQDGRFGRDAAAQAGLLTKVGGGDAGFDYTKVCNSGELAGEGNCPADPRLGVGANEWGCTLDNITGLMWEVKLDDATHLRHRAWTYTWYNPDSNTNGGQAGQEDTGTGVGSDNCLDAARCDTKKYVADVNAANLCGHTDWRLPSRRELHTLTHLGRSSTSIDVTYFPNTGWFFYWTSTPYAEISNAAWSVFFQSGGARIPLKQNAYAVRLVRGNGF